MIIPPSIVDRPAIECPPPRTATGRLCSRAKFTAWTTSAVPVQETVTAGCLLCIALNTGRTPALTSPRTVSFSSSIAPLSVPAGAPVVVAMWGSPLLDGEPKTVGR